MTQSIDEVIKAAEGFLASFDKAQRCPDFNKMLYDAKGLIRQLLALVPKEGEVVVPREPTAHMQDEGNIRYNEMVDTSPHRNHPAFRPHIYEAYKAMLKAAEENK